MRPYRLRHVIPLGAQLANDTWIVGVQLHDDCFIVEWVSPAPLREERVIEYAKGITDIAPIQHPVHLFSVEDDLGTEYTKVGSGSSGGERGWIGHEEFAPAPPHAARQIRVRSDHLGSQVLVLLPSE